MTTAANDATAESMKNMKPLKINPPDWNAIPKFKADSLEDLRAEAASILSAIKSMYRHGITQLELELFHRRVYAYLLALENIKELVK